MEQPALRPPDQVMKLARLGCFHQTRLSFMRALLRRLKHENWQFERTKWQVDERGVGVAVYEARGPERAYSLVCFANDLPAEKRSDRVIAEEWDATFVLHDGVPGEADIARLARNVPLQEAGHCRESELVLARANRSVRLFEHVVERLSRGLQPDPGLLQQVGYLMRTTAVYGSGKFGLGDRERIAMRSELYPSFRAEMLAVWLIRWFTRDIVEHMATVKNPAAVRLDSGLARQLGVGNATGLGMAPFLGNHPALIHTWILARETALARVRAIRRSTAATRAHFRDLLPRVRRGLESWNTADPRQNERLQALRRDLDRIAERLGQGILDEESPWDRFFTWSQSTLTTEGQELLVTLVIEPHGDLVDDLAEGMATDEVEYFHIDGGMTLEELSRLIERDYAWALHIDFTRRENCSRFWYVSEEKLEPRLGERFEEPGAEKEQPLAIARDVKALHASIAGVEGGACVADYLLKHPQYRHLVRRVQLVDRAPYAEIRDNLIAAEMVPIDLLRCKLSFFGASKFDPKSDRWIRINMYQYAPFPDEFAGAAADDWMLPPPEDEAA